MFARLPVCGPGDSFDGGFGALPDSWLDGVSAAPIESHEGRCGGSQLAPAEESARASWKREMGRNDNPFTPVSLRNYHGSDPEFNTGRETTDHWRRTIRRTITITRFVSRLTVLGPGRYSADFSWNAPEQGSRSTARIRNLHLDTMGGIAFFAGTPRPVEITGDQSIYISNIHAANLGLGLALSRSTPICIVGYNMTKDTGDGRTTLAAQARPPGYSVFFYNVQTFPLTYQTPLLRLSVRITQKLRYNVGYQYYGYHEDFGLLSANRDYCANTGYTSLLWTF